MKTKQQIQERINSLDKKVEVKRYFLKNTIEIDDYNKLLNEVDLLRKEKSILEWVLDLDNTK